MNLSQEPNNVYDDKSRLETSDRDLAHQMLRDVPREKKVRDRSEKFIHSLGFEIATNGSDWRALSSFIFLEPSVMSTPDLRIDRGKSMVEAVGNSSRDLDYRKSTTKLEGNSSLKIHEYGLFNIHKIGSE